MTPSLAHSKVHGKHAIYIFFAPPPSPWVTSLVSGRMEVMGQVSDSSYTRSHLCLAGLSCG